MKYWWRWYQNYDCRIKSDVESVVVDKQWVQRTHELSIFFFGFFFRLKRTNELQHMSSPNHDNLMKHVEKRKKQKQHLSVQHFKDKLKASPLHFYTNGQDHEVFANGLFLMTQYNTACMWITCITIYFRNISMDIRSHSLLHALLSLLLSLCVRLSHSKQHFVLLSIHRFCFYSIDKSTSSLNKTIRK